MSAVGISIIAYTPVTGKGTDAGMGDNSSKDICLGSQLLGQKTAAGGSHTAQSFRVDVWVGLD